MIFNQTEILQKLHIDTLNEMQQAVIHSYSKKGDLVLLSPTGTGKTLAYLLPLCEHIIKQSEKLHPEQEHPDEAAPLAVVLVPSRELAMQTQEIVKEMNCGLKAVALYGGRPTMEEHRRIREIKPQLLIATPGRLNDHLGKQNFCADYIDTLVIDEFDKSLELGFQEEMADIISQLPDLQKRILLSATDAKAIPRFVGIQQLTKLNYLSDNEGLNERLELKIVKSPEKDKLETLRALLCTLGQASVLVFVGFRESADRVAGYLLAKGFVCDTYHGGMEQDDRERALYKFRGGSCPILVATDLASRGLDITGLDYVIHYHLPMNEETFTHRNGRTARWDAEGGAFLIQGPEEPLPAFIDKDTAIQELPDKDNLLPPPAPLWASIYIGKGKKDKINKVDVVGFLSKKGGLQREDLGKVDVSNHFSFASVKRSKLKQLLKNVANEKIKGIKTIIEEAR